MQPRCRRSLKGARGIWFWSGRVWDIESLIAYNRIVRATGTGEIGNNGIYQLDAA
jgi:hypothetical protein